MDSFLEKVIRDINLKKIDLNSVCFILPNKRSSNYFKQRILEKTEKTTFSPLIQSIDSFIIKISGLSEVRESELVLALYESYIDIKKKQVESFEEFSSWAPTFIKDVSEIEQNLLNVQGILTELIEINKINNWNEKGSVEKEKLLFWEMLPKLYSLFKKKIEDRGNGTKGLCYREAKENLEHYKEANNNLQHVFIGLNSMSKSEELIVKELLDFSKGEIYWDIDKEFLANKVHGASFFIKKHKNKWERFKKKPFKWEGKDYVKKKNIQILGTPKYIGQAKVVGEILSTLNQTKPNKNVVILGDESIIRPVLNYLPNDSQRVNITIKSRLDALEIKNLISEIFEIQLDKSKEYSEKLKQLSSIRLFKSAFSVHEKLDTKEKAIILAVFKEWKNPNEAIEALVMFFEQLFLKTKNKSNEFIQTKHTLKVLLKSSDLLETYSFVKELNTLKSVIMSQLEDSPIGFKPNLNANTQIMGLLESRGLDFENVIITSVNEGVLPKGKTHGSLIPYDLRKKHKLLTYEDRDAIYTYHFYRLIKRAKNVFLIYNNFNEGVMGGEKSRFIRQIETEEKHNIIIKSFNSKIYPEKKELELLKSPGSIKKLQELAEKGFSPSSLDRYLKNREEFYYKNLLNIHDNDDTGKISPRTIGLAFHDSLEALYQPFLNKKIIKNDMVLALSEIKNKVQKAFIKNNIKDYEKGKTLIAFEVVKRAITTLIKNEIKDIELGNEIEIISLEKKIECDLKLEELKHSVKLRGIIDRLDKRNGTVRIIDYKTGLIKPNEVTIKGISSCFDVSHLKSMQLLCYALMYFKNNPECVNLEAGLISFRDLNKGLMKFGIKESSNTLNYRIDSIKINEFEKAIKNLIMEIMDPNHSFSLPS